MTKHLLIALALTAQTAAAQTAPIVKSVRHDAVKRIPELEWVAAYEQPADYAEMWKQVAECFGGQTTPLQDGVQFFFVNSRDFAPLPSDKSGKVLAVTYAQVDQIYIAVARVKDRALVMHEMAHQFLYWRDDPRWDDEENPAFKRCHLEAPHDK